MNDPRRSRAAWPLFTGPRSQWIASRSALCAGILFFVAYAPGFLHEGREGDWYTVYVPAAERMWQGQPIHFDSAGKTNFMYPPAMAFMATPLALLPTDVSVAAWYCVNVAALIVVFVCSWRLATGASLTRLSPANQAIFWLGVLISFRFVLAPLENQQFDIVIAALAVFGLCELARGRELRGAVALGTAAAMKCTPLLFAPYLVWRGKARAAGILVATSLAWNLAPEALTPQTTGRSYCADFWRVAAGKTLQTAPGAWYADPLLNQSLAGFAQRAARFGQPTPEGGEPPALTAGTTRWMRLFVYGSCLALLALTALAMGWRTRPAAPSSVVQETAAWEQARPGLEGGAILCLMLLLSPMSSKAHFVVLVLPAFLFARRLVERPDGWGLAALALLLVSGPFSAKGLLGKPLGDLMLAWGLPMWHVVVLLAFSLFSLFAIRAVSEQTRRPHSLRALSAGDRQGRPTGFVTR